MRYMVILSAVVCLLLMSLPSCGPMTEAEPAATGTSPDDVETAKAEIRETRLEMVKAFNNKDAKAMAALITENWESWEGDIKGRDEYEERFIKGFTAEFKDAKILDSKEISITLVTPDVAILKSIGEELTGLDAEGKQLPPVKFLEAWVYVKTNGKWYEATHFFRPVEQ